MPVNVILNQLDFSTTAAQEMSDSDWDNDDLDAALMALPVSSQIDMAAALHGSAEFAAVAADVRREEDEWAERSSRASSRGGGGAALSAAGTLSAARASPSPPGEAHLACLKRHFGHNVFRPNQWEIVRTVLEAKRDQLVVMATGYGKSVCYQYPAVFADGCSLVICPLISLMEDQVLKLNAMGIRASFLGSTQQRKHDVYDSLRDGSCRVLYVTPEFLTADCGESLLSTITNLSVVAVDEAHCISQWGHDFRKSYRRVGDVRQRMRQTRPDVPWIGLTATATPDVCTDIVHNLHLHNCRLTKTTFNRPNLKISVRPKSTLLSDLRPLLRRQHQLDVAPDFGGPTIVYCLKRDAVNEIVQRLRKDLGVSACGYHAGMSEKQRRLSHQQFITDKCSTIVATVAYGMGIDKPDIRLIVHYGAPKDLEGYYQEIGRGGRDGLPCECITFFAKQDFQIARNLIQGSEGASEKFIQHKLQMQQKMQDYLYMKGCRRRILLEHFGESGDGLNVQPADCCDNCETGSTKATAAAEQLAPAAASSQRDYGREAWLLFEAMLVLNESAGAGKYVAFVRGKSHKDFKAYHTNNKNYGAGAHRSEAWWNEFVNVLIADGSLVKKKIPNVKFAHKVVLSDRARNWKTRCLQSGAQQSFPLKASVALMQSETPAKATVVRAAVGQGSATAGSCQLGSTRQRTYMDASAYPGLGTPSTTSNPAAATPTQSDEDPQLSTQLYSALVRVRTELASDYDVAPYMIAGNKALSTLALHRPSTKEAVESLTDLTYEQLNKYAPALLKKIAEFCTYYAAATDVTPATRRPAQPSADESKLPPNLIALADGLTPTVRETYVEVMLNNKSTVGHFASVAASRGLAQATIENHLADALALGLPVHLKRDLHVDRALIDRVLRLVRQPPISSVVDVQRGLKRVMDAWVEAAADNFDVPLSYSQLRAALAVIRYEFGGGSVASDVQCPSTSRPIPAASKVFSSNPTTRPPPAKRAKTMGKLL